MATCKAHTPIRTVTTCSSTPRGRGSARITPQVSRRDALLAGAGLAFVAQAGSAQALSLKELFGGVEELANLTPEEKRRINRIGEIAYSEEEWKQRLSSGQYNVLRKEATERPFSNPLNNEKRKGVFKCAGCGSELFQSETKYNSGTGWPSFYDTIDGATEELPDYSLPMYPRIEVRCKACQGHLGHVFPDGPEPTGLRYCMNGLAMTFEPAEA